MSTVVTCYYNIPSKFSHNHYMCWIANFMSMKFSSVVFCDKNSFDVLSSIYPENETRKYRIVEMADFYVSRFDWEKDYQIDPEKSIHSIELYKIWAEKIFFVERAIKENVYNTEYFTWTDIGSFRDSNRLSDFHGYPKVVESPCVTFLQIEDITTSEYDNIQTVDNRFLRICKFGGGIFTGRQDVLVKFKELYVEMIREFDTNNIFKGKDQTLFTFIILRNPSLFNIVRANSLRGYDLWFYLHYWLSDNFNPLENTRSVTDFPVTYICPDHNEKYKKRNIDTRTLLEKIGFNSITHHQSGTNQYPKCLVEATIDILERHTDDMPFLLVEDDIAWTGISKIEFPPDADAIYLGVSFCAGHPEENTHKLYCELQEYSNSTSRVLNMLSAHAILYISKRYKQAVVNQLRANENTYNDVLMSRIQKQYNIYTVNFPIFYQDDDGARDVTKIKFKCNYNQVFIEKI